MTIALTLPPTAPATFDDSPDLVTVAATTFNDGASLIVFLLFSSNAGLSSVPLVFLGMVSAAPGGGIT